MSFLSRATKAQLNSSKHQVQDTSADVLKEFKSFLNDVEDMVQSSSTLTGEDLAKAKIQLKRRINSAKETIGDASGNILQQAKKTANITNHYVHEQPWTVIGAGVAASFLLGFLLSRRD